ncbi:MAG: glycosyltransferase [Gomphosphaeria aponina SAG 52.96 = DSM 107014]|uniref:Glycosyltransferase n=1 Tax=Gomphosphaeria aponina SAG 52.96 = DSM 107014 TaxID=1521640 RepID=A0A941GMQ9_9CHRO|nr:glycosyltransferase [Gomphosphaeria aponina SAG 52.96 = DSM 107014]
MKPLITVITSVLNGADCLEKSIQSVINQTAKKQIEYILIDGQSTDGTIDMIKKYEREISYWSSEADTGIYSAWNKGLKQAHGEWICFLGADDFFASPDTIETVIPFLEKAFPTYRVVYGKTQLISGLDDKIVATRGQPWAQIKKRFLQEMCIPHRSTFHHCLLFQDHGNFNSQLKISGDYDFLLRELKEKAAYFVDLPLVRARLGGISLNSNYMLQTAQERKIVRKSNQMSLKRKDYTLFLKVYTLGLLKQFLGRDFTVFLLDFYRQLLGKEKLWKYVSRKNP